MLCKNLFNYLYSIAMNIMDIEKLYEKSVTDKLSINDIEFYSNSSKPPFYQSGF